MKRSKKYNQAIELARKKSIYSLKEALELLPKLSLSKFEGSADIQFKLDLGKKTGESLKGNLVFPHQVKSSAKKIAVITSPAFVDQAKEADIVGGEDLIKKIEEGFMDFDILIATPDMMAKLVPLGKTLGPKGKMPNPKNDTVTTKVKEVITTYKKGKTDYKSDEKGNLQIAFGKVNMKAEELFENASTIIKSIYNECVKFSPIPFKKITISPTMGPSLQIDLKSLMKDLTLS